MLPVLVVEVRTRKETNKYDAVLAVHAAGGVDAGADFLKRIFFETNAGADIASSVRA
jgi:hypothetical protein